MSSSKMETFFFQGKLVCRQHTLFYSRDHVDVPCVLSRIKQKLLTLSAGEWFSSTYWNVCLAFYLLAERGQCYSVCNFHTQTTLMFDSLMMPMWLLLRLATIRSWLLVSGSFLLQVYTSPTNDIVSDLLSSSRSVQPGGSNIGTVTYGASHRPSIFSLMALLAFPYHAFDCVLCNSYPNTANTWRAIEVVAWWRCLFLYCFLCLCLSPSSCFWVSATAPFLFHLSPTFQWCTCCIRWGIWCILVPLL